MWFHTLISWARERQRFIAVGIQWLWIALVVAFCTAMGQHYWGPLDFSAVQISPSAIALSFALICLGKILLGLTSVRVYNLTVGKDWKFAFLAYHLSQPGKYIPGSVWQHVSRAYLYRNRGAGPGAIASALTMEAVWLIFTAMALGTTLLLFTRPAMVWDSISLIAVKGNLLMAILIIVAIGVGAASVYVASKRYRSLLSFAWILRSIDGTLIALLIGMWVVLGVSLYLLLPAANQQIEYIPYMIGLFAVAYGLGFVVVFAPAGLGVREAVLAAGLGYFVDITAVIVVISIHRILYLINDAVFFLAALLWQSSTAAESDAVN
jgi:uncharacterized membrane protein YbhN (UPF0104 family)